MSARLLLRLLLNFLLVGVTLAASSAVADDIDDRRSDFRKAVSALQAGDIARFKKLRQGLDGYILGGYLDYEYLKGRLDQAPAAEVRRFLDSSVVIAGSDQIRKRWLRLLAARGEWTDFVAEYNGIEDDAELQCLRLKHLLRVSNEQTPLMQEVELLWRNGRRLPGACDAVFATWKQAGHMTPELVWERIRLAMEARQPSLAAELSRYLAPAERIWVQRWTAMHNDPVQGLDRITYPVETPVARMVVRHGVVRLGFRDVEEAVRRWDGLKQRYAFFGEDDNYVMRQLGILAAQDNAPSAVELLSRVSVDVADEPLQIWRVRAALRTGDWERARVFIAALPEQRRQKAEWRYWMARALDKTGHAPEATAQFNALARERGYYGFLAADRINVDYSMQHQPVAATAEEVAAMLERPAIQAARELYEMGMTLDARRQWQWSTRHMNNRELAVAAVVAREWGWHDRAVLTVAKSSDYQDDLELRFPLLYREAIEASAERQGLEPSWVYGVVRQESAFVADARSPVGALGLMQLMPATGRITGRQLDIPFSGTRGLLNIDNNVKLGVGYLKTVLARHQNHQALATASYNAGPNRVGDWLPQGPMDADVWVETIPFNETRDYVKNVMSFTAVYDHRLGVKPIRLQKRMPAVESSAKTN